MELENYKKDLDEILIEIEDKAKRKNTAIAILSDSWRTEHEQLGKIKKLTVGYELRQLLKARK